MDLFFWIFLALALLFWTAAWWVCLRFRFVPVPDRRPEAVRISVIIPARNEESNLSRLLPSLREQGFAPHEIFVVDDQSTDGTAAVAAANGATVIPGQPLPEGWYGKPWACQQGARAASGEWLLFLDADLVVAPGGMQRLAGLAATEPDAVHSVCPHHRIERPYEELSAFFNGIMLLGTNAFTALGCRARETGLFGQAMLLSTTSYEAVDGHERVKNRVLENFHLAAHFRAAGIACRAYTGTGTLAMRMFPEGLEALVRGWSKGFVSGAGATPRAAMIGVSALLSGLIMMTISLSFLPLAGPDARIGILLAYSLGVLQAWHVFRHAGSFHFLNALLFPIALGFYLKVFFAALRRAKKGGTVSWKGRDVA